MFDIPSQPDVRAVLINEEVVTKGEAPVLFYEDKVGYA
jgi:ATP-dependent protease Clp ATPase subunit